MADGVFEFEGFRLDGGRRTLTDPAGKPVSLAPRVFDTLLYLVGNAGELVEKNALIEAVWPDVTVEDNSLSQNISTLRRALGDQTGDNRFIVTAPGRGYRFVANVRTSAQEAKAPEALAAPNVEKGYRASIAIMAFANMTGDPAKEYFADGMAEEIINMLTKVSGLKVPARMSAFAYKNRNVDARQIAEDLGVDAVLEGSIRSAGDRIRITAQIIDGMTGYHVWSQNFDREMSDLFELQEELAVAIVEALRTNLNAPVSGRAVQPTAKITDVEAYRLNMLGAYLSFNFASQNLPTGVEMFELAVRRAPDFARAHANLASARLMMAVLGAVDVDFINGVEKSAKRALELDPADDVAHSALGQLSALCGDLCAAEDYFRSVRSEPSNMLPRNQYVAGVISNAGYMRRAHGEVKSFYHASPFFPFNAVMVAMAEAFLDNNEEAARYIEIANELGVAPTAPPYADTRDLLCVRAGEPEQGAEYVIASVLPGAPLAGASDMVRLIHAAFADKSKRPAAIAALRSFESGLDLRMDTVIAKRLLLWQVILSDLDGAFAFMNRALDMHAERGVVGAAWGVLWLSEMKPFVSDPRFMPIAKRMGMLDYWKKYGPPDGYALGGDRLEAVDQG